MSNRWTIRVSSSQKICKLNVAYIRKLTKAILDELESENIPEQTNELSVSFVNDEEILKLNSKYRNKHKATDVLSFPQLKKSAKTPPPPTLGDIVISLEYAQKSAKRYGIKLEAELLRLLIHGILHLLGYDHENVSDSKRQKMKRKEKKLYALFELALKYI